MVRRSTKIAIIVIIVTVILIGIAVPLYFNFANKSVYHVTGLEKTTFTVEDFAEHSELRFYKNGTFHVRLEHKEHGLLMTAIGTYTLDGKTYQLTFTQAYGRNASDDSTDIVDITEQCKKISCVRSGNRIKFIDHNSQIFYFG